MSLRHLLKISTLSLLLVILITPSVFANAPKNKGLLISPIRQYVRVDAGKQQTGSFTVANLTDAPITTHLSVNEFSVTDYAYDYRFSEPHDDWIRLSQTAAPLKPNQSQKINYTLAIPSGTAPGGHYYTLLASAKLSTSGLNSDVQAASLLYITINGKLTQSSEVQRSSIKRLVFGTAIPYSLTVKNTGNVHYFAYISGKLQGLFTRDSTASNTHLLMPGTIRNLGGSIASPVLPGVYRATYGYKTDIGNTTMRTQYVVFIPPWSIAALLLIILLATKLYRRRKSVNQS